MQAESLERQRASDAATGSSRSPITSGRRTCGTRSRRGRCRRSTTSSPRSGCAPGTRVLDVGCGPGRHAHELARRGIVVHGIDIAQTFVDLARRDAPDGATFERLDARALPFDAEFDAVICLCQGAFGLDDRRRRRRRRRRRDGPGAAARRPAGAQRVQRLLRGPVPRGRHVRRRHRRRPTSAPRSATPTAGSPRSTCGPAATRRASCACCSARHGLDVDRISSVEPGAYGDAAPTTESPEYLVVAHRD